MPHRYFTLFQSGKGQHRPLAKPQADEIHPMYYYNPCYPLLHSLPPKERGCQQLELNHLLQMTLGGYVWQG
ncbi:MAG: hypothetical protein VYC09_02700 [Verrucomicrobiota bacterium]|nr:hypothetical protein [Verrucomicrobiota bacterium]